MTDKRHIELSLTCDQHLARLVRMTAANVAMLSSMSVDRIEDIRMAAEEAFIYACSATSGEPLDIAFAVDAEGMSMAFTLGVDEFPEPDDGDETATYADLILGSVCDSYRKVSAPATLVLDVKADL